jgi:superfamily II DNA or RNA helicase
LKLFNHQKAILKEFPERCALVWETGTGKTLTSIELVKKSGVAVALFICPKGLKKNWQIQLDQHIDYKVQKILLMTKEEFKKAHLTLPQAQAIVVDEAHNFFGMTSGLSKALIKYINRAMPPYVWLLTATPYRSSPWDIYKMLEILGTKFNYWDFRAKFFSEVSFGGGRKVPVIRKGIEQDIADLISSHSSIVKLEDCEDIPEQTFEVEYFDLTSEQKMAMQDVIDVMPIVRFTKYHQICGGTLKGEKGEEQVFDSQKMDRLIDIVNENEKIIIVSRYNLEIEYILKMILAETDKKAVAVINGDVDNRQDILDALKTMDEYVLIVNAAVAEGWELPECPLMVFYSYDFSLVRYIQMLGRIQRINNIKKNTYLSLLVKDSIDEHVYEALQRKEDFHIEVYSKSISKPAASVK